MYTTHTDVEAGRYLYPEYKQHTRYPIVSDETCSANRFIQFYGGIDGAKQQCAGYDDSYIVACVVTAPLRHIFLWYT